MKSATLIKDIGTGTTLYQCTPPMILVGTTLGSASPTTPFPVACEFIAVYSCEIVPGVPRVVVHQAQQLKGDDGWGYGGGPVLIADGMVGGLAMLAMCGYTVTRANEVSQA